MLIQDYIGWGLVLISDNRYETKEVIALLYRKRMAAPLRDQRREDSDSRNLFCLLERWNILCDPLHLDKKLPTSPKPVICNTGTWKTSWSPMGTLGLIAAGELPTFSREVGGQVQLQTTASGSRSGSSERWGQTQRLTPALIVAVCTW